MIDINKIIRGILTRILLKPKNAINVSVVTLCGQGRLSGRKIVVTGGSRGIGYAMAKKFSNEGASVIISGRNKESLEKACKEIGNSVKYICYDAQCNNAEAYIDECKRVFNGGFDAIVLNAGISLHEGNFLNVTTEGFDKQFDVNLRSNYFLAQQFINVKLKEGREANILFMSSETAGKSNDLPYGLTKVAINSLVGGLARRVYKKGIRVNAIAPGVTLTDMTNNNCHDVSDFSNNSTAGRYLLPEEIAEVACFLISDISKCITGEVIYCDSGSHLKVNGTEITYSL